MPVTKQSTSSYSLVKIGVDMQSGQMWCYFTRATDGVVDGGVEMTLEGPDMASVLATQAVAGQPLGDEITDAVYRMAISKGVIAGVIS
jgi:hypothetical protein